MFLSELVVDLLTTFVTLESQFIKHTLLKMLKILSFIRFSAVRTLLLFKVLDSFTVHPPLDTVCAIEFFAAGTFLRADDNVVTASTKEMLIDIF